jgi:hypothetical protein
MAEFSVPMANILFDQVMQYASNGTISAFPKLVFYTAPYINTSSGPQGVMLFTITLKNPISATGPVAGTLPLDVAGIVAATVGTGKVNNAWLFNRNNEVVASFSVGVTEEFDIQLEDDNIYEGSEARPTQLVLRFGCPGN